MTVYDEALEFTLGNEGGYYAGNEDRDRNPTNYGVTQKTYDTYRTAIGKSIRPVREIDMTEVKIIYGGYWTGASCQPLGRLSAITLFDHSINAGPDAARKILQEALDVEPDGVIGPTTKAMIAKVRSDDFQLADRISWERVRFYTNLAKNERLRPNLLSWVHRVVLYREKFLK